jgi:O-antigen/teichoic acid export membrane protein
MEINEQRDLARKLFAGAGFRVGSLFFTRLISVAKILCFARIFSPNEIGTATLALSCVLIVGSLANFGFFENVIRNRDHRPGFASTAFTLALIFGGSLFVLLLLGAPLLSRLFSAELDNYIRFLGFLVLLIPLQFPKVFWEKEIRFGHPSIALIIPEFMSLLVALIAELTLHLGVWSLVLGHALGYLLSGIYIWILAAKRPRIEVGREHVGPLMRFGTPFMLNGINGQVMARGDNLMVGAYAGVTQLAYYNFAWQLPLMISSMTSLVDTMLLPVYARFNDNRERIIKLFNLTNKMWSIAGSFLGFPILLFADEIVRILYGPSWDPVVPILRVMAVSFIIRFCTGYAYDNLVLVRGRTAYLMKWGFVNTVLVFTLGLYMIKTLGPIGGAWYWVIQAILLVPLIRIPLIRQELQTLEFFHHIWQPVICGLAAGSIAYLLMRGLPWTNTVNSIVVLASFVFVYLGMLFIIDRQFISDMKKFVALALEKS